MDYSIDLKGKTAVVTGAARGIGQNIAAALAGACAGVWIVDIDDEKGRETAETLRRDGDDINFLQADLSCHGVAESVIADVVKSAGKVDILVNNARAGEHVRWEDETEGNWDLAHAVMLRAPFFAAKAAMDDMAPRGEGVIVNIGSISGTLVSEEAPSYQAAKGGLLHLTRCLAAMGGPLGVRVNTVAPGMIVQDEHRPRYDEENNAGYREMVRKTHPLQRAGWSDDVAGVVLFLCSSMSGYLTGEQITLDGGLTIQDPLGLYLRNRDQ